jgi:hypothetical protein
MAQQNEHYSERYARHGEGASNGHPAHVANGSRLSITGSLRNIVRRFALISPRAKLGHTDAQR